MKFVNVASTKDIKDGEIKVIKEGRNEILIVNLDNKYYAIGNKCTHAGCKLSSGSIKDDNVECPCHGSVFDIKTGKIIKGPAKKPEPIFKVKIEGRQIMINV